MSRPCRRAFAAQGRHDLAVRLTLGENERERRLVEGHGVRPLRWREGVADERAEHGEVVQRQLPVPARLLLAPAVSEVPR